MAARFCPQCGHEQSAAAKFCTHCGASLIGGAATPPPAITRVDAAAQGTRRLLLPLGVAVLIVLAAAVAILAYRLTHTPAPPLTNAVAEYVPPAAPLTNATDQYVPPAPPLTDAPTVGPGQLPPDVAVYVEFLKGIEGRRVALSNDTSGATAMLGVAHQMQSSQNDPDQQSQTAPNNVRQISSGFTDYNAKWQTLIGDFRTHTAPPDCVGLSNQYWTFLTGYAKVISQLQVALLNGDIGAAMGAQGAQKQINDQALQADDALSQLCAHYNAPKPFSIQPDGASPSLLGP